MTLIAHLRGDLVFAREISQHACLENGVRQRFLTVDMLAQPDGHRGGGGMGVIRSGHDHRVDVLGLLFQHLAKVGILRRLGVTLEHMRRPAGIDVTKRDDVLAFAAVDIDLPLAAGTNRSDVEPFVGTEHPPRHHHRKHHAGTGHAFVPDSPSSYSRGIELEMRPPWSSYAFIARAVFLNMPTMF